MYKRVKIKKLGRTRSHRDSLIKSLIRSLFTTGSLETTTPKAKSLKEEVLRLVGKYKRNQNELILTRDMLAYFGKTKALAKAKEFIKDEKNNVSIVKTRFRKGDNAEMSLVTLVGFTPDKKKAAKKVAKKEEKVEVKDTDKNDTRPVEAKKAKQNLGNKIAKSLKSTFTGSKERARSRSGL